nr:hypothetical protein XACLD7_10880004 [Xanthomonas citri pv. citri]CEJ25072.1 hypothetical protein XACE116_9020003 [Xanthomonas citri pv. citri]CEJ33086.1 hypothetical protein XACE116_9020003 [Xanthomonas citri pv. citri]
MPALELAKASTCIEFDVTRRDTTPHQTLPVRWRCIGHSDDQARMPDNQAHARPPRRGTVAGNTHHVTPGRHHACISHAHWTTSACSAAPACASRHCRWAP